jgi:hypothetical protein
MFGAAIMPCGRVNVKSGKFQYGNFYGFWGNNTCYEVYRVSRGSGNIRVVATSGTKPHVKVDEVASFNHDQTGRFLFAGKCIETVVGDSGFKSLGEKYGNLIPVATYK